MVIITPCAMEKTCRVLKLVEPNYQSQVLRYIFRANLIIFVTRSLFLCDIDLLGIWSAENS